MLKARRNLHKSYFSLINNTQPKPKINFGGKDVVFVDEFLDLYNSEVGAKVVFDWFKTIMVPISDENNSQLTKQEYFKLFCCDLDWAKAMNYCKGVSTTTDKKDEDKDKKDRTTSPSGGGERRRSSCKDISWVQDDVLTGGKIVKKCMIGTLVGIIQERLKHHGFPNFSRNGNVDSIYGSRTEGEVIKFQKKFGLKDDGEVGQKTLEALLKDKSVLKPVSTTTTPPEDDFESDLTDVSTGTSGN